MTIFGCMYDCREPKTIVFALVDLGYMDGVSLHVETFKKEKWYVAILVKCISSCKLRSYSIMSAM